MMYDEGFDMFDIVFSVVPVLVFIGFITVFGLIIYSVIMSHKQYRKNNNAPILTVAATVVDKRSRVGHSGGNAEMETSSSHYTDYFVTFEVESKSRLEFEVQDNEYGFLVKGDQGKLTFQGTRFISFERQ